MCSFRFCGFWSSTPRFSTQVFVLYFYQLLFIINYFEVSMSHSVSGENNDRKGGNQDIEETKKSEQRGEAFLKGNLIGEFLILQKDDGGHLIGTYPVQAGKRQPHP